MEPEPLPGLRAFDVCAVRVPIPEPHNAICGA